MKKDKQGVLISVVVPVYNASAFLDRCIQSVLTQTYTNFELLLIDDGSTDDSASICNSYSQNDSRVVVVHKTNGGVSSARNLGLRKASGDWLLFLDNDDILPENTLMYYYHTIISDTGILVVQGRLDTDLSKSTYELFDKVMTIPEFFLKYPDYQVFILGKLFRASVAKKYDFPEGHYAEDVYYCSQFFSDERVKEVRTISLCTYIRTENSNSVSHNWNAKQYFELSEMVFESYLLAKKKNDLKEIYLDLAVKQFLDYRLFTVARKAYCSQIRYNYILLKKKLIKECLSSDILSLRHLKFVLCIRFQLLYKLYIFLHCPEKREVFLRLNNVN